MNPVLVSVSAPAAVVIVSETVNEPGVRYA